jgi:hypothetical protein
MIKKILLNFSAFLCISSVLIVLFSCEKEKNSPENTILIVDNEKITLDDFRNFYELDPNFPAFQKGSEGLTEYAEEIADKILCQRLAEKEQVLDSRPFKQRLQFKKNESIIKLFYNDKVKNQVHVSESDIRNAFLRMSLKLHVKHLYTPTKLLADQLFQSLQKGIPFDTLAEKIFAGIPAEEGGADLGIVSWGDLNPALEDVAYNLRPGEYSQPVASPWGYHILLVTDRIQNLMITESEYLAKRNQITLRVKKRKEELAAGEYLKNYLDPFNIKVKKEALAKIVNLLHIDFEKPGLKFQKNRYMTDRQIQILRENLKNHLDDPFMVSNTINWSIEEFLNLIDSMPWDKRPSISSASRFRDDIGILIRNKFLLSEALKNGFDEGMKIDSIMKVYNRELAYLYYLNKSYQEFKIPDEVKEYYKNKNNNSVEFNNMPSGILSGMTTPELYIRYHSARALHHRLLSYFPEITIQINRGLISKEAKKINWDQPVRMFIVSGN